MGPLFRALERDEQNCEADLQRNQVLEIAVTYLLIPRLNLL